MAVHSPMYRQWASGSGGIHWAGSWSAFDRFDRAVTATRDAAASWSLAYASRRFASQLDAPESLCRGKENLPRLCARIEAEQPSDLTALYALTEATTEELNALEAAGSEIETVEREGICKDFGFVASTYGFEDADVEKLVAARNW